MKSSISLLMFITIFFSCKNETKQNALPIAGTWQLVAATSTENGKTVSTFDSTHTMIKILNDTHFAFLNHSKNKDTTAAAFDAGGGTYTLDDSNYTEHLAFYKDKNWENNNFHFTVKFSNDTLVQKGIEKNEKAGVDHIIMETYKRIK